MVRNALIEAVRKRLNDKVEEVRHIDLWNNNVEFIEQEDAWERPAVFIEFGEITWSLFKGDCMRGSGQVRIHLVTDWAEGQHEEAFRLSEKIASNLMELEGDCFNGMALANSATNHNHEDILETIDTYAVRFLRNTKQ